MFSILLWLPNLPVKIYSVAIALKKIEIIPHETNQLYLAQLLNGFTHLFHHYLTCSSGRQTIFTIFQGQFSRDICRTVGLYIKLPFRYLHLDVKTLPNFSCSTMNFWFSPHIKPVPPIGFSFSSMITLYFQLFRTKTLESFLNPPFYL